ncbi:predicted protein [Postia placenta Mad-698-R]|nr:predicted protein [Postia placenta Mad-698-R]
MRRIAAVFASRRTDKSDATSSHRDDASTQHAETAVDAAQKQQQLLRPKARFFRTISRRAPILSSPHISTEPASSSSSSAGPPTPDDDARSLHPDRVYLQPFPDKAPPAEPTAVRAQASSMIPSQSRSALTASQSASAIAAVGPARSALAHLLPHPRLHLNDTDDDTSDSGDSERYAEPPPRARTAHSLATPVARVPPLPAVVRQETARARPLTAVEYARALAQNALLPTFAPPPTLHVPDAPLFPRSCNLHSVLQSAPRYDGDALLPRLFHERILHRLAVPDADKRALAPFTRRGKAPATRGPTLVLDDTAVPKAFAPDVRRYSEGLLRWIERPCFEDRFAVYLPRDAAEQEHGEDAVVCVRVSGTGLGVAELEYSEALEALAGVFADEDEDAAVGHGDGAARAPGAGAIASADSSPLGAGVPFPRGAAASQEAPLASLASATLKPQRQQASSWPALNVEIDTGGPLLNFSAPDLTPPLSTSASLLGSAASTGPPTPTGGVPAVGKTQLPAQPQGQGQAATSPGRTSKPAVRFVDTPKERREADDTSDGSADGRRDNIPLGYVQRIKQQRLEKAKFLAAEKVRRAHADQAQRRAERDEEERRRVESREREEERRRRMYAEEVAAARSRRESQRFIPPALVGPGGVGSGPAEWDKGRERERDRHDSAGGRGRGREKQAEREETFARPVYDGRRQSSSPAPPPAPLPSNNSARNSSPALRLSPSSNSARNSSPAPSGSGSQSQSQSQRDSSAHSHLAPPGALTASVRSSSAPDVRPRENRAGSVGAANRASMISDAGKPRTASFGSTPPPQSMWMASPGQGMPLNGMNSMGNMNGMNMAMNMNRMSMNMGMMGVPMMAVPVPVPVPVPGYGMPVGMGMGMEPLLPPTPPFVMQQFGYRPPSQHSQNAGQGQSQSREHSRSSSPGRSSAQSHTSPARAAAKPKPQLLTDRAAWASRSGVPAEFQQGGGHGQPRSEPQHAQGFLALAAFAARLYPSTPLERRCRPSSHVPVHEPAYVCGQERAPPGDGRPPARALVDRLAPAAAVAAPLLDIAASRADIPACCGQRAAQLVGDPVVWLPDPEQAGAAAEADHDLMTLALTSISLKFFGPACSKSVT